MHSRLIHSIIIAVILTTTSVVTAEDLNIGNRDTIKTVLTAQVGKRVSLGLKSGKEVSGVLTAVTDKLTHVSELTGKEFYDAVIVTEQIESVVVRTK